VPVAPHRRLALTVVVAAAALVCSLFAARAAQAITICPDRLSIAAGASAFSLPYCTNHSLTASDASIRRLVVVVHGTGRNAGDYENYMVSSAAGATGADALVVAPQFVTTSDGPSAGMLRWSAEGWKSGDQSQTTPSVSSYAAVDQLVGGVVASGKFPNLAEVVVAGHSAGGQFVERYAATNRLDGTLAVTMRYVVANPSSYLYLSPERPVAGSTTQFAVPSAVTCPGYDTYKYGLHGLNPYLAAVGADAIRAQFASRHVTYLLGSADTNPADTSLDTSCEGEMQGPYRLARGTSFFNYLGHYYGASVYDTQTKTIVAGVAHDGLAMFCSPEGRSVLFASLGVSAPAPEPAPAPLTGPVVTPSPVSAPSAHTPVARPQIASPPAAAGVAAPLASARPVAAPASTKFTRAKPKKKQKRRAKRCVSRRTHRRVRCARPHRKQRR
jgi:hypothetical protein